MRFMRCCADGVPTSMKFSFCNINLILLAHSFARSLALDSQLKSFNFHIWQLNDEIYNLMWCVYGFRNLWGHRANVSHCNAEKPSTTKLVKYFICINRVLLKIMRGAAAQFRNKFSLVMPRYLIITIIIIAISNSIHSLPRPPSPPLLVAFRSSDGCFQFKLKLQCNFAMHTYF